MTAFRLAVALALLLGVAAPAHAIGCRQWTGLDPGQRDQTLRAEFTRMLRGPNAARWTSLNRVRIEQCLVRMIPSIEADFDGTCDQGLKAPMTALDDILKNYAYTCAR